MKFYHGTSSESWAKIKEEGILFGRRYFNDGNDIKEVDRCTYLSTEPEEANNYGEILPCLWTRSYYVESVGHISEKTIVKYIEEQKNK